MNNYIQIGLDLKLISIDDVKEHTTLELIFLIIERINELTDGVNHLEVNAENIIREMLDDEMIANIITSSVIPSIEHNAIDVKSYGVKGDGKTDDTKAIQNLLDSVIVASDSGIVPNGTVRIRFPKGIYLISQPIKIKGSVQIDASGAIIKASQLMDAMIQIETQTQICGLEISNLILNGNGVAKLGLELKDVYLAKVRQPLIYGCSDACIKLDKDTGNTGICEAEIDGGCLVGGRNANAGGLTNVDNCIALHVNATDSLFRNVYTIDFKTHIYNQTGVNFYDHCHGWNMNSALMRDSVHFKVDWDINCVGCYTDTIQTAFEFTGDARALISNHEDFCNTGFYQSATFGDLVFIKVTSEQKGNEVIVNGARLDRNGQSAVISTTESKMGKVKFRNMISDFTSGSLVVGDYTFISGATAGTDATLWSNKVIKTEKQHVEMLLMGDIQVDKMNAGGILHLATLPQGTYNTYYKTPITVMINQYDSANGYVAPAYIETDGKVKAHIANIGFTATGSCQWNVNTAFYIQD